MKKKIKKGEAESEINVEKLSLKELSICCEKDPSKTRKICFLLKQAKLNAKLTELISQLLIKKNHIYSIKSDEKQEVWIYKEGIYIPNGKTELKKQIKDILKSGYNQPTAGLIIEKIFLETLIDSDKFFEIKHIEEIPLQNGLLNLKTRELTDFTPKKIFFNKLPITYNPKAKCPHIEKHFKDILSSEEDITAMYEIIGFILYKDYFIEKSIMLNGDGRNGKGKTIELIKRFVGTENCCSIPLASLYEESFELYNLHGKMVNIAGDLSNESLKKTGMLKATTGRDLISAKRKFMPSIKFTNHAKHIFACNELPRVYDNSLGFWSRWILLDFPYKFIEKSEYEKLGENKGKFKLIDPTHIEKITTPEELDGLLIKALDGLDRLRKNKEFSYTKGTQEIKDQWIKTADSFTAFCIDKLEEGDENDNIGKFDLRRKYQKYCKKHGLKGCSDNNIKAVLNEKFGATDLHSKTFGISTWTGIKFKELSEEEKEEERYKKGKL